MPHVGADEPAGDVRGYQSDESYCPYEAHRGSGRQGYDRVSEQARPPRLHAHRLCEIVGRGHDVQTLREHHDEYERRGQRDGHIGQVLPGCLPEVPEGPCVDARRVLVACHIAQRRRDGVEDVHHRDADQDHVRRRGPPSERESEDEQARDQRHDEGVDHHGVSVGDERDDGEAEADMEGHAQERPGGYPCGVRVRQRIPHQSLHDRPANGEEGADAHALQPPGDELVPHDVLDQPLAIVVPVVPEVVMEQDVHRIGERDRVLGDMERPEDDARDDRERKDREQHPPPAACLVHPDVGGVVHGITRGSCSCG